MKFCLIKFFILFTLTSCICQVSKKQIIGCWNGKDSDTGINYTVNINDKNIKINSINTKINTRLFRKNNKWIFEFNKGEGIYLEIKNNKLKFRYLDGKIRESELIYTILDFYRCE